MNDTIEIALIHGKGGAAILINDYRVCGPKPWGGGLVARKWDVDIDIIRDALKEKDKTTPLLEAVKELKEELGKPFDEQQGAGITCKMVEKIINAYNKIER